MVFTISSLALFVALPTVIGTRILDEANVVVALTAYTAALLVRAVSEALHAVPAAVRDIAPAVGYPGLRRMLAVEPALSLPVAVVGVRVVVATNIAMVAVGAVVGIGGLGGWFAQGYQTDKSDQIVAGIVAFLAPALALVVDALIVVAGRLSPVVGCYLLTADNWTGPAGLGARSLEYLEYIVVAVGAVNGLRLLPTLGVLQLGVLLFGLGLGPPLFALRGGTYAGVAGVEPAVVDAARMMGMTEAQVVLRVEVPNALAADPGRCAQRDPAGGHHRDGGRLCQPRQAGPVSDRRHQGCVSFISRWWVRCWWRQRCGRRRQAPAG